MRNYTFLFKDNMGDDRDCVHYIELQDVKNKRTCIDGKFNTHGACFSQSLKADHVDYDNITTILTLDEFTTLCNPKGQDLSSVIAKLESVENAALFEQIVKEERDYLMSEYGFSEEDVDDIFSSYGQDYRDRGVVGGVYADTYELGYETAWSCGYVSDNNSVINKYFDFEQFGEDILENKDCLRLRDGRCVSLNY